MDNLIVIRLDENLLIFDRDDVPYFYELEKTGQSVLNDGNELIIYEAPNEEIAKKIRNITGTILKEDINSLTNQNVNI